MSESSPSSILAHLHPKQSLELSPKLFKSRGRILGSQLLALKRPSRSPESARQYFQGDPINMIDWKAFARSDQLIVREKRDDAMAKVTIGLEVTDTMEWPRPPFASDEMAKIPLKQNVATRIAMHIAKVHLSMGDQVELWIFSDDSSNSLPERYFKPRDSLQILNVFEDLLAANFSKATFFQKFVPQVFQGKISDFVYWVGDGLSHSDYGTFLAKGKRPCFIHTLSSLEVDISWMSADVCYFDESLERKEYLGQSLLASGNYLNGLHDWRHRLEKRMNKNQGGYLLATDQTATDYYMEFLSSIVMG